MKWAYKITFWIAEYQYIDIKDLKEWDIVDKGYLIKMLRFFNPNSKKGEVNLIKNKINLIFNNYITNNNVVSNSTKIKSAIKEYNNFNKNNPIFNNIKRIKILKTFSFWIYIFLWFLITFLLKDQIFNYLINNALKIISKSINN